MRDELPPKLPFSGTIYNSAAIYKGQIWGVCPQGVFSINLGNVAQSTLLPSANGITGGFVLKGNTMYFIENTALWSYTLP